MRIVFFGTSTFAAHVLLDIIQKKYNVVAVVTRPDKPQGRSLKLSPPPVKNALHESGIVIDIHQPEKASAQEFAEILSKYEADLFLVLAYGEILKDFILKIPRKACVNIHASLLPKYRGAAPIQRCIMDGESETGITIIEMVAKMDAGSMIAAQSVTISSKDTFVDVENKLLSICEVLVPDVLDRFEFLFNNKLAQDESKVTFAPKIMPEDLIIDWSKSAEVIHNQVRALSPLPCAYCFIEYQGQVKRLKVRKSEVLTQFIVPEGKILIDSERFLVGSCDHALSLLEVQLEGKKFMTIKDFILGLGDVKKISLSNPK